MVNSVGRVGVKGGVLTYCFDVAKGAAAVMLIRLVAGDDYFWIGAAAIAAIVGTRSGDMHIPMKGTDSVG